MARLIRMYMSTGDRASRDAALVKLLCLSDIHGEGAALREILPGAAEGVDAVVLAGDLTHLGGYKEAEALLAPLFSIGLPLLAVAGNMEYEGVRRYIGEKEIDIHGRGVELNGVGFMGLGGGTPSPFHSPGSSRTKKRGLSWQQGLPQLPGRPSRCSCLTRRRAEQSWTASSPARMRGPARYGSSLKVTL